MMTMKTKLIFLLCLVFILCMGASGNAESLYDPKGVNIITDLKARAIGDIVFIVVEERTTTTSEANTGGSKQVDIKGGLQVKGFFEDLLGFPNVIEPLESMKINPNEAFKSSGQTSNKGTFTTRIAATVIDVLPNGNFVIEGKRAITINADTETMKIVGTVRPTDIAPDNTIKSQLIADTEMSYTGRGQLAQRQKSGLFTKLFNFLF